MVAAAHRPTPAKVLRAKRDVKDSFIYTVARATIRAVAGVPVAVRSYRERDGQTVRDVAEQSGPEIISLKKFDTEYLLG